MAQKPSTYTDFASFADDVRNGKVTNQKNKKKKTNKAFVPAVELKLPPRQDPPTKQGKKRGGQQKGNQGRGAAYSGQNRGGSARGGRGGDNYGRRLTGAGDAGVASPYGRGVMSGYPYYGDGRDHYYSYDDYGYEGYDRFKYPKQKDPFRMNEMAAALSYYEYGFGREQSRGRRNTRKN